MPKPSRKRAPKNSASFAEILDAWRLWLLGAALGAALALVIYFVAPPAFRAHATVVVDQNLEEAWVFFPDRQLFQFLARETEKLVELAWSDAVMQAVSAQSDLAVQELRGGVLQLSQPSDGGWHFYAMHAEADRAQQLAAAWAQAFVEAAQAAVEASPELQTARAALEAELLQAELDESRLNALMAEIKAVAERTRGLSPYIDLSVNQAADLPLERSVSQSTYLFVGSLVGALAAPLWMLLDPKRR